MKRLWLLCAVLLIVGCTTPAKPPVPDMTSADPAPPAKSAPVPPPTPPPLPVLRQAGGVVRLESETGGLGGVTWIGPAHALVHLSPINLPQSLLLVDLNALTVQTVTTDEIRQPAPDTTGKHALVFGRESSGAPKVSLVDTGTDKASVILGAQAGEQAWQINGTGGTAPTLTDTIDAAWVNETHFVLSIAPPERSLPLHGSLLVGDLKTRTFTQISREGTVTAILPDGALLVRTGWMDGALDLYSPPYTDPPKRIAPGGPWRWGWSVSTSGRYVAWMDMTAPPGDWSQRLPYACCSGDPRPFVKAIAVWDRTTGKVTEMPASGVRWPQQLAWRSSEAAVIYMTYSGDNPTHTLLNEIALNGRSRLLKDHDWAGPIAVHAEADDGTLYYTISGQQGQNWATLIRLKPDGKAETLKEGLPSDWQVLDGRFMKTEAGGSKVYQNLRTGQITTIQGPGELSPHGTFFISGGLPDAGKYVEFRKVQSP